MLNPLFSLRRLPVIGLVVMVLCLGALAQVTYDNNAVTGSINNNADPAPDNEQRFGTSSHILPGSGEFGRPGYRRCNGSPTIQSATAFSLKNVDQTTPMTNPGLGNLGPNATSNSTTVAGQNGDMALDFIGATGSSGLAPAFTTKQHRTNRVRNR